MSENNEYQGDLIFSCGVIDIDLGKRPRTRDEWAALALKRDHHIRRHNFLRAIDFVIGSLVLALFFLFNIYTDFSDTVKVIALIFSVLFFFFMCFEGLKKSGIEFARFGGFDLREISLTSIAVKQLVATSSEYHDPVSSAFLKAILEQPRSPTLLEVTAMQSRVSRLAQESEEAKVLASCDAALQASQSPELFAAARSAVNFYRDNPLEALADFQKRPSVG